MPRPPIYRTEPSVEIAAAVRESCYEALKDEASHQGRPMARLTADALELYLAQVRDDFEPRLAPDQVDDSQLDMAVNSAA